MALLPILRYPDPRLHKVAARVERVDDKIRKLIKDMAETMYAAPGVGLAATQVDVHQRVIVIDISDTHDELQRVREPGNPGGERRGRLRGRLSVGAGRVRKSAPRPAHHGARARTPRASAYTLEAEDLLAVCIQHEMDHLEGKVFVELSVAAQAKPHPRQAAESRSARRADGPARGSPTVPGSARAVWMRPDAALAALDPSP